MSDAFKPLLSRLADGAILTEAEAQEFFAACLRGEPTPAQIGAALTAIRMRGETVDEITGAAEGMRAKMLTIKSPPGAMDVVGTGGDQSGSYNVSTCTAIVVAGCGVPVAKHGNRAMSSKCGSADVLAALGVAIECDPALTQRSLDEAGICFMLAPRHHAAMKHVGPTRGEMGTRTVFNLLGPLSNPAGVKRILLGVFARQWVEPLAHVLRELGTERAWVVHGSDGLDEMTISGPTFVAELKDGKVRTFEVAPRDAGLPLAKPESIKGADAATNAAAVRTVLAGERNAFRDIVLLNAAAALMVAGKADDLKSGAALAAQSIDQGKAKTVLARMVAATNAVPA